MPLLFLICLKGISYSLIGFSETSIYWTPEVAEKRYFTKQTLINALFFLFYKCIFTIANFYFRCDGGKPRDINSTAFCVKLLLYLSQLKHCILNNLFHLDLLTYISIIEFLNLTCVSKGRKQDSNVV